MVDAKFFAEDRGSVAVPDVHSCTRTQLHSDDDPPETESLGCGQFDEMRVDTAANVIEGGA